MYFCLLVTKFIIGYSCVSLSYHSIIAPIIMHEMILPQPCWNPGNTTIGRNIIFFVENIFYIEGTSNFVIFDCLYFLLATNLRIQFALLRKELNSIDFKEDSEEKCFARLVKCSQYHKLLLSVHRKINTIYSAFFLLTYVFTITSTCTLMFVVFYMEADAALLGKSIFIVIILNTLLVMTFIPAGELEIEGEKLAMDIYFMNWYETSSLKIRKFILFWLMRAQIPLQMTGGGMLVVNRPLVLQAERVSYSLASFLANL
nr:PREDICTED: odorant receptor 43a-like [Tribolium castaneum]|eukprot:XP_015839440.1 PREDICTED: odorant receptor 43a-like [Tribolium castaneum]